MQMTVDGLHLRVRRHDVDVIWLKLNALSDLNNRKFRVPGEQRRQGAGMLRGEMLNEHNREMRIGRQRFEQLAERFKPAGRGADADDRERRDGVRARSGSFAHHQARGLPAREPADRLFPTPI